MPKTVILHLTGDDPVVGEVEDIPSPVDNWVAIRNPRRRDGKQLQYTTQGTEYLIYSATRVTFIEVMRSSEDQKPDVVDFFRESQ